MHSSSKVSSERASPAHLNFFMPVHAPTGRKESKLYARPWKCCGHSSLCILVDTNGAPWKPSTWLLVIFPQSFAHTDINSLSSRQVLTNINVVHWTSALVWLPPLLFSKDCWRKSFGDKSRGVLAWTSGHRWRARTRGLKGAAEKTHCWAAWNLSLLQNNPGFWNKTRWVSTVARLETLLFDYFWYRWSTSRTCSAVTNNLGPLSLKFCKLARSW